MGRSKGRKARNRNKANRSKDRKIPNRATAKKKRAFAVAAACLLLLIVIVALREPQNSVSPAVSLEPSAPERAAPDRSTTSKPRQNRSTPRTKRRGSDSILVIDPWSSGQYEQRLGKVLLPKRADSPEVNGDADENYKKRPFIGAESCAECHQDKFDTFVHTSHFKTSQVANAETIMGSSQAPNNKLTTRVRQLHYRIDPRDDGVYQTAVVDGHDVHSERIDIIFGSGKVGQTYLYWRDNELFELPVSYFTARDSWMNSPGYRDGTASFARPIVGRCLECHATWFKADSDEALNYHFSSEGYILGVTCVRCHGPNNEHVAHHRAHPDEVEAKFVVHPGDLPRERLLDVCGQCHGGLGGWPIEPAFSFRPGKELASHVNPVKETGKPGVHSNDQRQRLSKSRCFQQSPEMSCTTCHDPHQFERGNHELFAARCQQCHEVADCALQPEIGSALGSHCARCHMPRTPLLDMDFKTQDKDIFPEMIDHHIRTGVGDQELEAELRAGLEREP